MQVQKSIQKYIDFITLKCYHKEKSGGKAMDRCNGKVNYAAQFALRWWRWNELTLSCSGFCK